MLYYLIYVSKAAKLMDEDDLTAILELSKARNSKAGITGMLLYIKGPILNNSTGNFIQVLEGREDDVKKLFNRIKVDTMHHSIVLVAESTIEKRNFSNWLMAFKVVTGGISPNDEHYFNIENFKTYHSKPREFNVPLNYLKTFYSMYS